MKGIKVAPIFHISQQPRAIETRSLKKLPGKQLALPFWRGKNILSW